MPPKLLGPKTSTSKTPAARSINVQFSKGQTNRVGYVVQTQKPTEQPAILDMSTIKSIKANLKNLKGTGATESLKTSVEKQRKERNAHKFTEEFQRNIEQQKQEIQMGELTHFTLSLISSEEARKLKVVTLTNPEDEGEGSVRDSRLGPHNTASLCGFCFQNINDCTGHYGLIETPHYVLPAAAAATAAILTSICANCGACHVTYEQIVAEGIHLMTHLKRFNAIRDLVIKNKEYCKRTHPPPMASCADKPDPIRVYDIPNEDNYLLHYKYLGEGNTVYDITPAQAYAILARISAEDATKIFGFSEGVHPKYYIPDFVMAAPYNIRPDIKLTDHTSQDYMSSIYQKIIKHSREYAQLKDENEKVNHINAIIKLVYILHKGDKAKKGSGRGGGKEASITDRINGKNGLLRGGEGRTAHYTARAVAASGYNIRVDEAGIPLHIAKKITVETKVTSINKALLQSLYRQGISGGAGVVAAAAGTAAKVKSNRGIVTSGNYRPGRISHIIQVNDTKNVGVKKTISDTFMAKNPDLQLQVGDTVWRYLMDGDVVLLNRQPTLHKYGMLAFYVKIIPEDVVRLPYEVAPGYNADFDGDELNMHFPQTVEAMNEAIMLAGVANNVMSVASGRPNIVMIQDQILAAYMLSYDPVAATIRYKHNRETTKELNTFVGEKIRILTNDTIQSEDKLDMISEIRDRLDQYLHQRDVQLKTTIAEYEHYKAVTYDMLDQVRFDDALGEIIDRPQIQSLRQRCARYGVPWGSRRCLFSAALPVVVNNEGQLVGFTYKDAGLVIIDSVLVSGTVSKKHVGSSDANMMTELYRQFDGQVYIDFLYDFRLIANSFMRTSGFSASYYDALPEDHDMLFQYIAEQVLQASARVVALSAPGLSEAERYQNELKIQEFLNITKAIADVDIPEYFPPSNPFSMTSASGSKGSALNTAQMSALLGQQLVYDQRPAAVLPGGRVLSVFATRDKRPEAHGFIKSSYFTGLTSTEYFFLTLNSRENLSNTSQQTSVTGHNQRQSVKGNEDFVTGKMGQVENSNGKVVQPVYGDNGFNTERAVLITYGGGDGGSNSNVYMPRSFINIANALNVLD